MTGIETGCSCGGAITVLDSGHVSLRIDTTIFCVAAILRTAYKLTESCAVILDRNEDHIVAFLVGARPMDDVRPLVGVFANELIDQQVREHLEHRFEAVRTLITAQAFSEGNLLDPERDDADYHSDPRGIGKPR